jgi:wyosine [tRNA(Phe)-imidazoG37] synthetase (radical SAM superfamily)
VNNSEFEYVYGPVPSRRLGRSLGVDLVPFKTCTYDCVYCQLGRTTNKTLERKEYVPIDRVVAEVARKLAAGDVPDYIALAGSGEPTLHSGIGELIREIKRMTKVPVAVLTNGSLLWMSEVREALMAADLVLPSLDAGDERTFRYVNRPHTGLAFRAVVDGIAEFTRSFAGQVWLEVFLLEGVTGVTAEAKKIAALVERISPARVQLNTVSRPPAEEFAFAVSRNRLGELKRFFPGQAEVVGEDGGKSAQGAALDGARDADILALLSRRPCTSEDVARGLRIHVAEALKCLEALAAAGRVKTVLTGGRVYYSAVGSTAISGG